MDNSNSNSNGAGPSWQAQLDGCTSPWQYLEIVRTLDVGDRPHLFEPWLALVNKCPLAEREALLNQAGREGWDLWKIPVATMRDGLKALAKEDLGQVRARATVSGENFVADMIYNPALEHPYSYLVHRFDQPDAQPEVVDRIKVGKVVYVPPMFDESLEGAVLFASGIEEFGTERELHQAVLAYLAANLQMEETERDLVATFIEFTWIADRVDVTPYLRMLGDWGSGKSSLQRVAGSIAYRGIFAAGAATPSPLFRLIDAARGTLILDEADHSAKSETWEQIEKLLLVGHAKGPRVLRAESSPDGGFGVRGFDPYGPKVVAMRRPFKDPALESRCLTVTMPLVNVGPEIPLFGDAAFRTAAGQLRNKLALWRLRRYPRVAANPRDRVPGLDHNSRLMAITIALLAVTDDPARRARIVDLVRGHGAKQRALRAGSLEGQTAQVLVGLWSDRAGVQLTAAGAPVEIALSRVTAGLRDVGLTSVTARRTGELVRTLGLGTVARGGVAFVIGLDGFAVRKLVDTYGAALPVMTPRTPILPPRA